MRVPRHVPLITLGEIETPGNGGYGRGAGPSYTQNLSTWPLYLRPTYREQNSD
jgi:hypothetical protein